MKYISNAKYREPVETGENMEDRYLFKAKRKDNGEWVQGYYVKGLNMYDKEVYLIFEPNTMFYSSGETDGWYKVDLSTICRCTGLKDKNGKLIWENDICDRKEEYPEIVKYNNGDWTLDYSYSKGKESGYCYCNLGFYALERKCVEVIGNIFDNKELLESEG
nr:MAG TPA: YopX protein [Bacteriophage sp.]